MSAAQVEWERWHAEREASLAAPYGWLTLTGFAWLPDRSGPVEGLPGQWWSSGDEAHVQAVESDGLTDDGKVVDGIVSARVEEAGSLDWVRIGTRQVQLLRRGGRLAVRTRDPEAATQRDFTGVPTYPYDGEWVLPATFHRWAAPQRVEVTTARRDLVQQVRLVGSIDLVVHHRTHRLQVSEGADGTLGLSFHDSTNGASTAPWRTVSTSVPDAEGNLVVDFNRAVNLPFAFTEFGTCPAPVSSNQILAAVTAGEQAPA